MLVQRIDNLVKESLASFVDWIFSNNWKGRENEAIGLYSFGHLAPHFGNDELFQNPVQICIEGTVPGVPGKNPKGRVRKDLIIWPASVFACWDENWKVSNYPLSVMEWKVFRQSTRKPKLSQYDVDWLIGFSKLTKQFVGYAVTLDLAARGFRLMATRCHQGEVQNNWLHL